MNRRREGSGTAHPTALFPGIGCSRAMLLAIACAVCASLTVLCPSAFGYVARTYESQLRRELIGPQAIAIDSADNVWIGDSLNSRKALVKYNYSNEQLPQVIGGASFGCGGGGVYTAGVDRLTDDLYVADACTASVDVFDSTATPITALGPFIEGEFGVGQLSVAVDNSGGPTQGRVYASQTEPPIVNALDGSGAPNNFSGSAGYIEENRLTGTPSGPFGSAGYRTLMDVAVDSRGDLIVSDPINDVIDEFAQSGVFIREVAGTPDGPFGEVGAVAADPTDGDILVVDNRGRTIDEFDGSGAYLGRIDGSETPSSSFAAIGAIAVSSTGRLYVADPGNALVDIYSPSVSVPEIVTGGVSDSNAERTAATLNGTVSPNDGGAVGPCRFEYVDNAHYEPAADDPFAQGHVVPCSPSVPYGTTTKVSAPISELVPGGLYRYRLLATDANGTSYGKVQSFDIGAPTVGSVTATELTPSTATLAARVNPHGGDTHIYFEYGPTDQYGERAPILDEDIGSEGITRIREVHVSALKPHTTYHFRLVASNAYGELITGDHTFSFYPPDCPNSHLRQITGTSYLPDCRAYELISPADAGGTSLFPEGPASAVATDPARFAFGGFLGTIPGAGDPPNVLGDLYVATRTNDGWVTHYVGIPASEALEVNGPPDEPYGEGGGLLTSPSGVRATPGLSEFADWNDGDQGISGHSHGSLAPQLWGPAGESLGTWPTVTGFEAGKLFNQSADFSHYFFEDEGVMYDNDTARATAIPISFDSDDAPIAVAGVPGSSADGSRVLMSTARCVARAPNSCSPGVLYMRTNDAVSYDVSLGHVVRYVGMAAGGTKVYFTSEEQLTAADRDSSTDLYMWEEESDTVSLLSIGAGEAGSSDECEVSWTTGCGVVPYTSRASFARPNRIGGIEGNGLSDNAIAAADGDIYFYSPEQLDGEKGVSDGENLYDYRDGHPQYVTTLDSGVYCTRPAECTDGPIVRIQVSPDDTHMAFLTASKVTDYDSEGLLEMYGYDPATEALTCVSCLSSGQPPESNVEASSNGAFMTNDGRVFYSTSDALVAKDTDGLRDVYEYVDGEPHLISSGTSAKDSNNQTARGVNRGLFRAGLAGVSANGEDVYFSTYDTLVGQDLNGGQLKFYDARVDGGFESSPEIHPCDAAAECHGPGTESPAPPKSASGVDMGAAGNFPTRRRRRHRGRHLGHKHGRHRARSPRGQR